MRTVIFYIQTIFLLLLIPILALNQQVSTSQNTNPSKLPLDNLINEEFKEYHSRGLDYLLIQEIRILGFSLDGKIAYALTNAVISDVNTFPDIYGPLTYGIYPATKGSVVIIQDLYSDKILWAFNYGVFNENEVSDRAGSIVCIDNSNCETCKSLQIRKNLCLTSYLFEEDEVQTPLSFNEFWEGSSEFIMDALEFYNISYINENKFYHFPISYQNDILNVEVEFKRRSTGELFLIEEATINLNSEQKGQKNIFNEKMSHSAYNVIDAKVIGCIKNPYEDQIAILLVEVHSIEGDPGYMTHFQIIGATLTQAFN